MKLNPSHQIVVLEMGTNQPGDIAWMSYVGQPDAVILTNVGESHLEKLKTPAGVFKEKSQILKYLSPKGSVILNGDDKFWSKLSVAGHKRISYGLSARVDVQGKDISSDGIKYLTFRAGGQSFRIRSPFQHNVHNALAAVACGKLFKVPAADIQKALAGFKFEGGRQDIQKIKGVIVINDTYNSNPVSFRSAVQTLDALKVKGKKILVCADMKELGEKSVQLHKDMTDVICKTSIDIVFSHGDLAKHITQSLRHSFYAGQVQHFDDLDRLCGSLEPHLQPGNAILVKGSRSMKMERVVGFLSAI